VITVSAFSGGRSGKASNQQMYGNRFFAGQQIQQPTLSTATQKTARTGTPFMSAWAIILVIVAVIVLGAVAYYATMCWPLLCRQERHYDIMDISSSTTPTRSHEFEKGDFSRPETPQKVILDDVDNHKQNMSMKY
jgi:hypothetical protein